MVRELLLYPSIQFGGNGEMVISIGNTLIALYSIAPHLFHLFVFSGSFSIREFQVVALHLVIAEGLVFTAPLHHFRHIR